MPGVIITRCRLCAQRFEEPVFVQDGWVYLTGRQGDHPSEDGNPWCPDCLSVIMVKVARLLDGCVAESPATNL